MMKSFFKKLAFVMALAMVVSLAAPAAQKAVAAEETAAKKLAIAYQGEKHYTISEVNLANVGDFEDLRFLYAPANYKELGVKWTSSNEAVATVDENGLVTAVAAGTAVVTVAVGTDSASVTVNVGTLPTYTVNIGEGDDKEVTEWTLKVGEDVDFAFYGVKDYGRDKIGATPRYACQWGTDDPTVLSNDGNGVFTALKAGTAKATLMVINVVTNQIHNVIPVNVTVEADATPTPTPSLVVNNLNESQNTVLLDIDADATYTLSDLEFYRVFKADDDNNGDGVIDAKDAVEPYQHFYAYTFGYDKNVDAWRVTTFDDFADGATYEVRVGGRTEQFVASVGPVATVKVYEDTKAVLESEDSPLVAAIVKVKLYDAKGVDVTTRYVDGFKNNDDSNISYELVEYDSAYALGYNDIEFYEDVTAKVIATYNRNGEEVKSTPFAVKPSKRAAYGVEEIIAWTLVAPGKKADWTKITKSIPAGEKGWVIATLLKDTRGTYYTTHEASADVDYVDANGKKHDVLWTEDEEKPFWMNGLYVQYKAMNADQMLVETFGEVESYEEGKARYALYLYNYKLDGNEFVKELYSQYVTVCCPMELKGITADNNVSIMKNTKDEVAAFDGNDNDTDDYYSLFSVTKIGVTLWDIHKDTKAKDEHALAAEFDIALTSGKVTGETDAQYAALKALVEEEYAAQLTTPVDATYDGKADAWFRQITVKAEDFVGLADRNQVKFRITETTTKSSVNVTINLKKLAWTIIKDNTGAVVEESKVALVKELTDKLGSYIYFEKFVLDSNGFTVKQYIENTHNNGELDGFEFALKQPDKNGNIIGYDSNIYLATSLNPNNVKYVVDADMNAVSTLTKGDRVLVVKDPNGKWYPLISATDIVTEDLYTGNDVVTAVGVKNTVWNKKTDKIGFGAPATSSALGVQVIENYLPSWNLAKDVAGNVTDVFGYQIAFRTAVDSPYGQKELVYAPDGRYTLTVMTVESVDNNVYQMREAKDEDFALDANDEITGFLGNVTYYTKDEDGVNYTEVTTAYDEDEKYYVVKTGDHDNDANTPDEQLKNKNIGNIVYATSTGLKSTIYANVTNNNLDVTYAGRDLTRINDHIEIVDDTISAADDYTMKKYILEAFNFNLGGSAWGEAWKDGALYDGDYKLSMEDILYYTYTVSPTNDQIVINTVTFKVRALNKPNGWTTEYSDMWYRATATVNKSLTFIED